MTPLERFDYQARAQLALAADIHELGYTISFFKNPRIFRNRREINSLRSSMGVRGGSGEILTSRMVQFCESRFDWSKKNQSLVRSIYLGLGRFTSVEAMFLTELNRANCFWRINHGRETSALILRLRQGFGGTSGPQWLSQARHESVSASVA